MAAAAPGGLRGGDEGDVPARQLQKRYDSLITVRSKAVKGKGAWYWAQLEPILVQNPDSGMPKAVKLRCSLCNAMFSASNPSRTASEHLKRGTCPNFNGGISKPMSGSSPPTLALPPPPGNQQTAPNLPPNLPNPPQQPQHRSPSTGVTTSSARKRSAPSLSPTPLAIEAPPAPHHNPLLRTSSGGGAEQMVSSVGSGAAGRAGVGGGAAALGPLVLSGGKEDLSALALLEDNVKKLKSPGGVKMGSTIMGSGGGSAAASGPSKAQTDAALNTLAEWLYESCGTVSFSCMEHPKFKAFLDLVGLPPLSRRVLAGPRLDAKFEEVKLESEAKLRDAMFFQLASDGWKRKTTMASSNAPASSSSGGGGTGETLISITLNLPNGGSLFRSVINVNAGAVCVKLVEETLWEAITAICCPPGPGSGGGLSPAGAHHLHHQHLHSGSLQSSGGGVPPAAAASTTTLERCVGIVADTDKYSAKALRELEYRNRWMINLSCQAQGFSHLLKDFNKHLSLFRSVAAECIKLAHFFNNKPQARSLLQKHQAQQYDGDVKLLRTPPDPQFADPHHALVLVMLDDIAQSARALQLTVLDDTFRVVFADDPPGRDVADMVRGLRFWSELEAVLDLVKLVKVMVQDIEADRPLVSQCLPLWDELRSKVKDWCARYDKDEAPLLELIEKRFAKNYHPAWAAAFILDPLYLLRDASGKYLPPFKCLSPDQEKDVDRLITRLVTREEAHIALMELMKWRAEGLDPLYAQAVQVKERDLTTGRMKAVNPQSRRLVWETCLNEFKLLGKVAVRLIFLHATSCGVRCNWSLWRWAFRNGNSRLAIDKAEKMIFIASHAKLERREFLSDEERDAQLFMNGAGDDPDHDDDDRHQHQHRRQRTPPEDVFIGADL